MEKQRCIEKVLHARTGQPGVLEQCKRYAIEGSERCKRHTESHRPASSSGNYEQEGIR